jgi:hypothetical protein
MKFLLSQSDVKKLATGWDLEAGNLSRSREFILVRFCEEPRIVITKMHERSSISEFYKISSLRI